MSFDREETLIPVRFEVAVEPTAGQAVDAAGTASEGASAHCFPHGLEVNPGLCTQG